MELLKKVNLNTVLFIVIIILAILYFNQCGRTDKYKTRANIAELNQYALIDTIHTYETKNGDLVSQKGILIASEKELKNINKELHDEVKDLKDNPKIVFVESVSLGDDEPIVDIPTDVINYPNGITGLSWKYDTTYSKGNGMHLAGETRFKYIGDSLNVIGTTLSTKKVNFKFTTGLTETKDSYKIFIKSDYPGFKADDIQGSILDKKMVTLEESRVVIGPSVGYGVVLNPGGTISHGVTVGFNITYNLNRKVKKAFSPFGI